MTIISVPLLYGTNIQMASASTTYTRPFVSTATPVGELAPNADTTPVGWHLYAVPEQGHIGIYGAIPE